MLFVLFIPEVLYINCSCVQFSMQSLSFKGNLNVSSTIYKSLPVKRTFREMDIATWCYKTLFKYVPLTVMISSRATVCACSLYGMIGITTVILSSMCFFWYE
jgi:hypothetical protein